MIRFLLPIYQLAWTIALPWLRRSPRLAIGWPQRVLAKSPTGPFDLWIQAASGGESLLTNMILAEMAASLPPGHTLRVLATAGTSQGLDTLEKGLQERGPVSPISTVVTAFPFDSPRLMAKAFNRFNPRLCVTLETELWPSFLWQARRRRIPTLVVNGRMSPRSFGRYKHLRRLFSPIAPTRVLAISPEDGERFGTVLGREGIGLMPNIKFDRIKPVANATIEPPFAALLPAGIPFVLFGSIRREEEEEILTTITRLLKQRQDIFIGLFPKHIERADHWLQLLAERQIDAVKRSGATTAQKAGSVMVWDVFGELAGAYQLAQTTFIGGSLRDLGGQNFLEPLVFGLKPIIGPYWTNFAWVTRRVIEEGLVQEIPDGQQLADTMLGQLANQEPREQVIARVQDFLASQTGGTRLVSGEILKILLSADT